MAGFYDTYYVNDTDNTDKSKIIITQFLIEQVLVYKRNKKVEVLMILLLLVFLEIII